MTDPLAEDNRSHPGEEEVDPGEAVRKAGWRPSGMHILLSIGSLLLAAFLIVVIVPKAAGAGWHEAFTVVGNLEPKTIFQMTLLWAVGLFLYTFVYTGSLPGLTHSQGLALNLTGSLVSNLLPFGGAAGVATTYGLTFSWGFSGVKTSLLILVSGLANLLIRLVLPLVGLIALVAGGTRLGGIGGGVAAGTMLVLAIVSGCLIAMLTSARVAGWVGAVGDIVLGWFTKLIRKGRPRISLKSAALRMQEEAVGVIRNGWLPISFGMTAYYACEIGLFGLGLHALGAPLAWSDIIAAFALSRVLSAVVVTPSGVGISEAGVASLLVLFGTPPAIAAAGVLILACYTFLIEVPTGVLGWIWVIAMRKKWAKRGPVKPWYRRSLPSGR